MTVRKIMKWFLDSVSSLGFNVFLLFCGVKLLFSLSACEWIGFQITVMAILGIYMKLSNDFR